MVAEQEEVWKRLSGAVLFEALFLAVSAVLGVTGVLAALGPLQRALSIDPASCLRCD